MESGETKTCTRELTARPKTLSGEKQNGNLISEDNLHQMYDGSLPWTNYRNKKQSAMFFHSKPLQVSYLRLIEYCKVKNKNWF